MDFTAFKFEKLKLRGQETGHIFFVIFFLKKTEKNRQTETKFWKFFFLKLAVFLNCKRTAHFFSLKIFELVLKKSTISFRFGRFFQFLKKKNFFANLTKISFRRDPKIHDFWSFWVIFPKKCATLFLSHFFDLLSWLTSYFLRFFQLTSKIKFTVQYFLKNKRF